MGDGLNTLKEIGAQKIHNDTHISREYAQAIVHETFDGLKKVQFMGFISILEKEYDIDLSDLRAKGQRHFDDLNKDNPEVQKVFITPAKRKDYSFLYKLIGVGIFISVVAYTFMYLNSIPDDVIKVDDTNIESATKNLSSNTLEIKKVHVAEEEKAEELNTSALVIANKELNETTEEVIEPQEQAVDKSIKILPQERIWAGIVEIETNKKKSLFIQKEYELNASKNWLFLFGGGAIDFDLDGEVQKFESKYSMRFKLVDGKLEKIDVTEFKSLNRGRKW